MVVASVAVKSLRTTRFQYQEVTSEFIANVYELVAEGHSVVLLGPSGAGKQLVLAQIQERLTEEPGCFHVRLRGESFVGTDPDRLHGHICQGLEDSVTGFMKSDGLGAESWRLPLRRILEEEPFRVVFLVSNVDAIPAHLARSLLKSFRELTDIGGSSTGRFSVLLTGAFDLAPLVYGADSELSVRDQYVIQGFGLDKFVEFYLSYANATGLKTDRQCAEFLFSTVGGQLALSRLVMEELLDARRAAQLPSDKPTTVAELREVVAAVGERRALFSDVMLRPLSRLEGLTDSLRMVEELIRFGVCPTPSNHDEFAPSHSIDPPTELELCGVARRVDNQLVWASELTKSLAIQYFSDWTLGDCYACGNQWKDAFRCYRRARLRKPSTGVSSTNRRRLEAAHRAFESSLFRVAGGEDAPVDRLREFFVGGARVLLGFDEATFWKFNDERRDWERVTVERRNRPERPATQGRLPTARTILVEPNEKTLLRIRSVLPAPEQLVDGVNPVCDADAPFVLMIKLLEFEGRPPECVILSNFGSENPLTRERRSAASAVLRVFGEAYQQARKNQQRVKRATLQQSLLRAIPNVLKLLGGRPNRTRQTLQAVGDELRTNRYRRVLFSIVDYQRRLIRGVVDCRGEGEDDVAPKSVWPLDVDFDQEGRPLFKDVQQKCIVEQCTLVIEDAKHHDLTYKELVEQTGQKAIALIPLSYRGRPLGTMFVERADRRPLDLDDINAFELFASQLAPVIEATVWMDALEEATLRRDEAILIVDPQESIRFVNDAAARQFSMELGWQDKTCEAKKVLPSHVLETLRRSKTAESPSSRYVAPESEAGEALSLRIVDVRPIKDRIGAISGYILHLYDLNSLARLLTALRRFAACRTKKALARAVLEELRTMGHGWGRLYQIDETNRLVGLDQFGLGEDTEGAKRFRAGTAFLSTRREGSVAWACIDEKSPTVIANIGNRARGQYYTSPKGLQVFNGDEECPDYLRKQEGDHWIDLPLFSREDDRPLGKISVECSDKLGPEKLQHLQILAEAAGAGFAAMIAIEEREQEEIALRRREMLRVIGEVLHQLKSKLVSLTTLTERYPTPTPSLNHLNEQWDTRLSDIQTLLDSYKSRLRPIRCERQRGCLVSLLRSAFEEQAPEAYRVHSPSSVYLADFDARLLNEALGELILNARKSIGSRGRLQMSASISPLTIKGIPWCRIDIRDNGPGIPQNKRERIFEELFSEWPHGEARGTGLGLSLVTSIIAEHGGVISAIESESGACFRIEFPRYSAGKLF